MEFRSLTWITGTFLVAAVLTTFAAAPAEARRERIERACREDARELCQGIRAGHGRINACLKARLDDLSDGCRAIIDPPRVNARDLKTDCRYDIRDFCRRIRGRTRIVACLLDNRDEVSRSCQGLLDEIDPPPARSRDNDRDDRPPPPRKPPRKPVRD
jgi:hypothetical protein